MMIIVMKTMTQRMIIMMTMMMGGVHYQAICGRCLPTMAQFVPTSTGQFIVMMIIIIMVIIVMVMIIIMMMMMRMIIMMIIMMMIVIIISNPQIPNFGASKSPI